MDSKDGEVKFRLNLAALVIAYLRPENLKTILVSLDKNNVQMIYVAVDYPKNLTVEHIRIHEQVMKVIEDFRKTFTGSFFIKVNDMNLGCAVSVITACNWFFENVDYGLILEDDCIPTADFILLAENARSLFIKNTDIWFVCGTQHAPKSLIANWSISNYPLNWGWCTTSKAWNDIYFSLRKQNLKIDKKNRPDLTLAEISYWNAGARRAYEGRVDVWDTIVVQKMQALRKFAILPRVSLVSNVGFDKHSTNTKYESRWMHNETGKFEDVNVEPISSNILSDWLRLNFFKISNRHLLSTKLTRLLDIVIRNNINPLLKRI